MILVGDVRDKLKELRAGSVHCCITSPPYWGLRDYGTAQWEGGDAECDHLAPLPGGAAASGLARSDNGLTAATVADKIEQRRQQYASSCRRCGARRIDAQLGLEPTIDEWVANMVAVFAEVRRVLRPDGTLWLNLGDGYAGTGRTGGGADGARRGPHIGKGNNGKGTWDPPRAAGLKEKDLIGQPWRLAFALQADGWVLRSDIVWSKLNPMPESVTDRPTKSHEMLFLFSKAKWVGKIPPPPQWRPGADWAWLAAIIDGEGSICFQDRVSERSTRATYSIRLSVSNTSLPLLDRVEHVAGITAARTRLRDGGINKSVYAWQITNAKAAIIIQKIRPYLVAKQIQADLALTVHLLNQTHKGGRGKHTTSASEQEIKQRCSAACSDLNRGRDTDLSWFTAPRLGYWTSQPYAYDADAIREAAEYGRREHTGEMRSVAQDGRRHTTGTTKGANPESGRNKRDVWQIATEPYPDAHFATYPTALVRPCIRAGCPVGGTVLDPFLGSGTTMLVAHQEGRDCIGIELNPEYAALARKRCADGLQHQLAI